MTACCPVEALPVDCTTKIFSYTDDTPALINMASVSHAWCERLKSSQELWTARINAIRSDRAVVELALTKATALAESEEQVAWYAYMLLTKVRVCQRCQLEYTDGANGTESCRFHSGVLFSGGRMNGTGVHWTCCGVRAYHTTTFQRHANGCTASRHVGGGNSLYEPHITGVRPRPFTRQLANRPGSQGSSGGPGSPRGGPAGTTPCALASWSGCPQAIEWHPDKIRGTVEALPSKITFANSCMQIGF